MGKISAGVFQLNYEIYIYKENLIASHHECATDPCIPIMLTCDGLFLFMCVMVLNDDQLLKVIKALRE